MPGSDPEGKAWTKNIYITLNNNQIINTVLDLGTGQGTYSNLLRNINRNIYWIGVDVWGPYIDQFKLKNKYDEMIISDIRYLDYTKLRKFDLVFMGDILEHMSKSEALKIVDILLDLSKIIIISIPNRYAPQGAHFNNPYEEHIEESYSHEELLKLYPNICTSFKGNHILSVFVLSKDCEICRLVSDNI